MNPSPDFRQKLIDLVMAVPPGKVVSYGQVATELGIQDVRLIGYAMHSTGDIPGFPWWRVVGNTGRITIKDPTTRGRQKELLVAEGIKVNDDFAFDIQQYRHGSSKMQQRLI